MSDTAQTYKTHVKFVPLFHYVTMPILLGNLLVMAYHAVMAPSVLSIWAVAMAVALVCSALLGRVFALGAQDRVIRLEERLRMRELLPPELKARIGEFSRDQLIALRFASDGELPELAATVLRDNIQKRGEIKKLVRQWRPDTHQL